MNLSARANSDSGITEKHEITNCEDRTRTITTSLGSSKKISYNWGGEVKQAEKNGIDNDYQAEELTKDCVIQRACLYNCRP